MAAEQLDDSFVISRINMYSNTFKYHQKPKACYSTCMLRSKRSVKTISEPELVKMEVEEGESSYRYKAPKRRKKSTSSSSKDVERECIICDKARESSGNKNQVLYRFSESDRAALFVDALNFYKDEVKTRCASLDTAGDVFAADIFYHGNCLRQYLLSRYSVTHIRNLVNANLKTDQQIDNRRTKVLLIKCFRDTICFTYPDDRRKSQMVNSPPAVPKPDLLQYGYEATDIGITPVILTVSCRPDDLPPPCKCPTSCMSTKTCTC
ncbi:hypothetical protein GWK47_010311 [Chionoecetes opilio]|uniref:Uncharacterized protein n=1 Tax=Chionoecetes opilio TaxID=41210 RepID=A0A8J4Y794_CHIOP|nr:hypothetical protein GWK47_010311 [Chionoecetes opilio]